MDKEKTQITNRDFWLIMGMMTFLGFFGMFLGYEAHQPCDCNTTERFSCNGLLLSDCATMYLTDYNIVYEKPQSPEPKADANLLEQNVFTKGEPIILDRKMVCCYPSECSQARNNPDNCNCIYAIQCNVKLPQPQEAKGE